MSRALDPVLDGFATEVGPTGPVAVVGGRTNWHIGGPVLATARLVSAPSGVVEVLPDEMIVRVRAGTSVEDLAAALAEVRQETVLPVRTESTVGGVVAVGRSGVGAFGSGPLRDALLEVTGVTAEGRLFRAGGPTVKNATGYDLCRLLVGSLGTLGLLAEVVLRTRPQPEVRRWMVGPWDSSLAPSPRSLEAALWDGASVSCCLRGRAVDVENDREHLVRDGFRDKPSAPSIPSYRYSIAPDRYSEVRELGVPFLIELGVGIVHLETEHADLVPRCSPGVALLNQRVKSTFDPTGRLSPGRQVWVP